MGLREELRAAIKKQHISVAKLARRSDIHQDTIYNFLRGKSEMTAENLDKLFKVLVVTGVRTEPVIDGQEPSRTPMEKAVQEIEDETFQTPISDDGSSPMGIKYWIKDAEEERPEDVKDLYRKVNALFVEKGGGDFIAFAAYVLCLDEDEVGQGKLTVEQLKQIKAYIETSGVEIS